MNIIFVKWGTKYSSDDVNILYRSLKEYGPSYSFFCYTEDPTGLDEGIQVIHIPEDNTLRVWWNKLKMFDKEFPIHGKTMYFDLDIRINSNPFYILDEVDWTTLTVIESHWKPEDIVRKTNYDVRINSSVITWDADNPKMHQIWELFDESGYRDYFLRKYVGIDRYLVHESFKFKTFPISLIQSYKYEREKVAPITTFEELNYGRGNPI